MNKVELAKMIGLEKTESGCPDITKGVITGILEDEFLAVDWSFCNYIIEVYVDAYDLLPKRLDIKLSDLEEDGDIKVCIKQVEDLLWERAAEKYLAMVHNVVMKIGG